MDPIEEGRRQAGRELETLAREFELSDSAALWRTRMAAWAVTGLATIVLVILLIVAADWRYAMGSWAVIVLLVWGAYALSSRRQRGQTARLRDMAARWQAGGTIPRA